MRPLLGICVAAALVVWILLTHGMMAGAGWAFRIGNAMQAASGLGLWFPPLFILVVPVVLVVTIGFFNRNTRMPRDGKVKNHVQ